MGLLGLPAAREIGPVVFALASTCRQNPLTLELTNTLSRRQEPFMPLRPGVVSMYCCGVTVYDLCHLGHARSYIIWDVLRRYLIWRGYTVTFVQNFTDIDDKILHRAAQESVSMQQVSERNIESYFVDMDALNIMRADRMPRATACLTAIRNMILELERRGAAYSSDGDVYFSVANRPDYGKLSHRDLRNQKEGASGRIDSANDARKQHQFDFALWKSAKVGEPSFPSPWGQGRPGWHIECSAMVRQELGDSIDIHLGGADLIFPHHENEIAQSEAATGKPLARYWLHNGMVNVGGEKMSKSLGNFTTIRALLESGVSPMMLRLFVLQAHYRKPLDFTQAALDAASTGWKGLADALTLGHRFGDRLGWAASAVTAATTTSAVTPVSPAHAGPPVSATGLSVIVDLRQRFIAAMDDDLNSAGALAVLFDLARPLKGMARRLERGESAVESNGPSRSRELEDCWHLLVELAGVLGLRAEASSSAIGDDSAIRSAIAERARAKADRDYTKADRIRADLREQGIELIDKPGGVTEWLGG